MLPFAAAAVRYLLQCLLSLRLQGVQTLSHFLLLLLLCLLVELLVELVAVIVLASGRRSHGACDEVTKALGIESGHQDTRKDRW